MNNFFTFAINSIFRRKAKNLFIFIVLTILIFINLAVFTVSKGLKSELLKGLEVLPDIIVQKIQGGRQVNIEQERVDKILSINGVSNVFPRNWGYYYFDFAKANFVIIGIDIFEESYKKDLNKIANIFFNQLDNNKANIIVGQGVYHIFKTSGYKDFAYFKVGKKYLKIKIAGVFKKFTNLESSDNIVMPNYWARKILGLNENYSTDIAVIVSNPLEINNVKAKIYSIFDDVRIITKKEIALSYQNIFDYKKSIFTIIISISLFTFFMIIFDKLSGVSADEKKEVSLLKSLGFSIQNIIRIKFYEAIILSSLAYFTAFLLSLIYVYYLGAPIIKEIFSGYSVLRPDLNLAYNLDLNLYFIVFIMTIPIYIIATIIPSWKIATLDSDEVDR